MTTENDGRPTYTHQVVLLDAQGNKVIEHMFSTTEKIWPQIIMYLDTAYLFSHDAQISEPMGRRHYYKPATMTEIQPPKPVKTAPAAAATETKKDGSK